MLLEIRSARTDEETSEHCGRRSTDSMTKVRLETSLVTSGEAGGKVISADGQLDEYTKKTLMDMSERVLKQIAKNYEIIQEGVGSIMGRKVLDYDAKRIKNEGREEGWKEGRVEGREEGREEERREWQKRMEQERQEWQQRYQEMQKTIDSMSLQLKEASAWTAQQSTNM